MATSQDQVIRGTKYSDNLTGTSGDDIFDSKGGDDDIIDGLAGNDKVIIFEQAGTLKYQRLQVLLKSMANGQLVIMHMTLLRCQC